VNLREVQIDEATWSTGSEARRIEWTSGIQALVSAPDLVIRPDLHRLEVTLGQQAFELRALGAGDAPLTTITLSHDLLAPHIQEYVDIVRQLAKTDATGGLARLEALDMAKKVCHDRAGRTLERRCRELAVDHVTARRLYTLLLTLRVDTTRLVGVHGHRRVR